MNFRVFVFYLVLLFINILALRKRKNTLFVFVLSFVIILILMSGNYDNADYAGYLREYNTSSFTVASSFNHGFVFLLKLFGGFGFSYNQFLIFYFSVFLLPFFIVCYKHVRNGHLAIFVYASYMMFWDLIQIRFFAAESLLLVAFCFLACNKRICFCISILIGSLFHVALIPFILLVFYSKKRFYRNLMSFFFVAVLLVCLATFINGNSVPLIDVFLKTIFPDDLSEKYVYFIDSHTRLGFLTSFLCYFLTLGVLYMSNQYVQSFDNKLSSEKGLSFSQRLCDTVFYGTVFASFALPLTMMDSNFIRFIRIMILPLLICVCATFDFKNSFESQNNILVGNQKVGFSLYKILLFISFIAWMSFKADYGQIGIIFSNNLWLK